METIQFKQYITYQDFCKVFVHWGSRCSVSPLNPNAVERRLQNSLNDLNFSPVVLRNLNSYFYERSFLRIGIFGFILWFYDCILEKKCGKL